MITTVCRADRTMAWLTAHHPHPAAMHAQWEQAPYAWLPMTADLAMIKVRLSAAQRALVEGATAQPREFTDEQGPVIYDGLWGALYLPIQRERAARVVPDGAIVLPPAHLVAVPNPHDPDIRDVRWICPAGSAHAFPTPDQLAAVRRLVATTEDSQHEDAPCLLTAL